MILSTKSAGSSALQDLLTTCAGARHVEHTRHSEHETLYWTKAASILGKAQLTLPESESPIPRTKALHDLKSLLMQNVPGFAPPTVSSELVYGGWRSLCHRFGPFFVEKSPHHLHQWGALELVLEAVRRLPDIEFRFIGLVRNPMDVLYSMWRRWRTDPDMYQYHWVAAYENLRRFQSEIGDQIAVIRYEDLAVDTGALYQLLRFIEQPTNREAAKFMHAQSINRWKNDPRFGFRLNDNAACFAASFGYAAVDLDNESDPLWPLYKAWARLGYRLWQGPLRQAKRIARRLV